MIELRFLLDENVSPKNVSLLNARGYFAEHVAHAGASASCDADLFARATRLSQVVITKNGADFIELASDTDVHPGIIYLADGLLTAAEEWSWLVPVLEHLEKHQVDPVNIVIQVIAVGLFNVLKIPSP